MNNLHKLIILFIIINPALIIQIPTTRPPGLIEVWNRTFGSDGDDRISDMYPCMDGGFVFAGATNPIFETNEYDGWLVKSNAEGILEWNRTVGWSGFDKLYAIEQTSDGGFITAGVTRSSYHVWEDGWILRTDGNGFDVWNKTFGGALSDMIRSVTPVSDGGFVLGISTVNPMTFEKSCSLLRLTTEGVVMWNRSYTLDNLGSLYVIESIDDGFIIVGGIQPPDDFDDVFLAKTNSTGFIEWNRTLGDVFSEEVYSIQQTLDGGYVLAGETDSFGAGKSDGWVVKLNATGELQWSQAYGGTENDRFVSVYQTLDGGYVLAGETNSFGAGRYDGWVVKVSENHDEIGLLIPSAIALLVILGTTITLEKRKHKTG